jgi:hypothetical protein
MHLLASQKLADVLNLDRSPLTESRVALRVFAGMWNALLCIAATCVLTIAATLLACFIASALMLGWASLSRNFDLVFRLGIPLGSLGAVPVSIATLLSNRKVRAGVAMKGAIIWSIVGSVWYSNILYMLTNE